MPVRSGAVTPMQGGRASASISGDRQLLNVAPTASRLPTPDKTIQGGVSSSVEDCRLRSKLFEAMGAADTSACGSSPPSYQPSSRGNGDALAGQDMQVAQQRLAELQKGSLRLHRGLFQSERGSAYCVSPEGGMAQSQASSTRFASIAESRELPDIVDPACEDVYASERQGCPPRPRPVLGQHAGSNKSSFLEEADGDASSNSSPSPDAGDGAGVAANPSPSPTPGPDEDLRDCSKKFTRVGSQPRSVAVVLLKWRREYYESRESCCQKQGNTPGCDCMWDGRTWDNLLPPKAWSRIFTDECDKGPSINRAYYDMTGGRVTFHSKLRVPVPSGYSLLGSAAAAPVPQDDRNVSAEGATPDPQPPPPPSPPDYVVSSEPVETATSYLNPDGVDVYGWATLDAMRDEAGNCRDWCGDAVRQLGVNGSDYNHIVCMQQLGSPAICDTCKEGACINTCPADTGITTGCGCGTCYYAWGAQNGCSEPVAPGANTGLGGWASAYTGSMVDMAGGEFMLMEAARKMYLAHELGHNLGLTHTGAIQCTFNAEEGTIIREPSACRPDWYGDKTSFMGGGAPLQLPAAIRYKVGWLPRNTLRTHQPGTERRWLLRPVTVRRPSWQKRRRVRWFGNGTGSGGDALAIRIPLVNPSDGRANVSSFSCPCNPMPDGVADGPGLCPGCTEALLKEDPNMCKNAPCCTHPKCADRYLRWVVADGLLIGALSCL
eukprot:GHRQ01002579.1.p1 GENE.GHRQ01002579.1~~GHRQ01002579.1.p1  ORF type:complete len:766 (+),score=185.71 GHRQ01002579.1:147-2300(+)